MWQANAEPGANLQPDVEELSPQQKLYNQAMGDLSAKNPAAKMQGQRGNRSYSSQEKDNGAGSIFSFLKGNSNGNSTTMAGPDVGNFGNIV